MTVAILFQNMASCKKVNYHNNVPRMRFSQFDSINSFELVSDYNCISPLSIMSKEIYEGLIIGVKDDTIGVDLSDGSGIMFYSIQYGII